MLIIQIALGIVLAFLIITNLIFLKKILFRAAMFIAAAVPILFLASFIHDRFDPQNEYLQMVKYLIPFIFLGVISFLILTRYEAQITRFFDDLQSRDKKDLTK